MVDNKKEPPIEWDRLHASRDFRDLFCYQRGDELRIYKLRVIPGGAELWRTTERIGEAASSLKEDDFTSADEVIQTLEDLKRRLKAGGWQELADEQ
jgi:hypothetical protein